MVTYTIRVQTSTALHECEMYSCDVATSLLLNLMRSLYCMEGVVQKAAGNAPKTLTFFDALTIKRLTNTLVGARSDFVLKIV